jgi:hypothetical protein
MRVLNASLLAAALVCTMPSAGSAAGTSAQAEAAPPASASPRVAPPAVNATAAEILDFAAATSGGDAWLYAETNVMSGHATLCRDANPARCVHADRYVMYRVYPKEVKAAHAGTGKFRLDAVANGRPIFRLSFDGERSYDQNGPVPPEKAASDEANAFGFSAIRFARTPGYRVERLTDDDVEARPCFMVRVTDPSGQYTLFGVDREDGSIRYAGWKTPRGWHERLYSDFYWIQTPGFRQPGRVRLYYEGLKAVDIRWTEASIGQPLEDRLFVLP